MKIWSWCLIVVLVLLFGLWLVRLILPSQVDDVSSGVYCSENVLEWADVYYVIPKFGNVSLDEVWCEGILGRGKELAMHGVYHEYREFDVFRDVDYVGEGVGIFEGCFGFEPDRFKPSQLVLSRDNNWIRDRMEVDLIWNHIFHKVYHCCDSVVLPNLFVRIF